MADMLDLKVGSVRVAIAFMRLYQSIFLKRGRPRTVRDEKTIVDPVIEDPTLPIRTEAKELGEPSSAVYLARLARINNVDDVDRISQKSPQSLVL
jgi:hypothetical protein